MLGSLQQQRLITRKVLSWSATIGMVLWFGMWFGAAVVRGDFREEEPTPVVTLNESAAHLPTAASSAERQLQQIHLLVEAEAWQEAVDGIVRLLDQSPDELVALTDDHYVPLGVACHLQISRWPAAALEEYRGRIDDAAQAWFDRGLTERSEEELLHVVDDYFCSQWGDDALLRLGELALERGDYTATRRYWQPLAASLCTAEGQPWGLWLQRTDLNDSTIQQLVATQFQNPQVPATRLVYPDADLPAATLLARLAIVSLRERNWSRAEVEATILRQQFPDATGRIAGRDCLLSKQVDQLLAAARQWPSRHAAPGWPTFGGNAARGQVAPPLGDVATPVWSYQFPDAQPDSTTVGQPLATEHTVVCRTPEGLYVLAFDTGRPAFGQTAAVLASAPPDEEETAGKPDAAMPLRLGALPPAAVIPQIRKGRIIIRQGPLALQIAGLNPANNRQPLTRGPQDTLHHDVLYTTYDDSSPRHPVRGKVATAPLRGLDLAAEGKLIMEISPPDAWRFSGPAVIEGEHLYLPLRNHEAGEQLAVACYHRYSGRPLWHTTICSLGDRTSSEESDLLTLGSQTLFVNSGAGVIAALHTTDGQYRWARTYRRGVSTYPNDLTAVSQRPLGPTLVADGILVCAPPDAPAMFALDAATGRTLWINRAAFDVSELLGVVDNCLVATGRRLWRIDLATGESLSAWPASLHAGIAGSGRGLIAGEEIFWPTTDGIYTLSIKTGEQTRLPLQVAGLRDSSVNLAACDDYLVAMTADRVIAFGPVASAPPTPTEATPLPGLSLSIRID